MFEPCTAKSRAALAAVLEPLLTARVTFLLVRAQFCESSNLHAAIPHGRQASPVRSQTVNRSKAAKLANICITIRPLTIAGCRTPFPYSVLLHSRPLICLSQDLSPSCSSVGTLGIRHFASSSLVRFFLFAPRLFCLHHFFQRSHMLWL